MTRRRTWLGIWLPGMIPFAAVAAAGFIAVAVMTPVQDGRYWFMGMIAVTAVVTIPLNMWMAWEATRPC